MVISSPCPRGGALPAHGELRCPRCGLPLDRPAPRPRTVTARLAVGLTLLLGAGLGLPFLMHGSDRLTEGPDGMRLLNGPDRPGGPTYGDSARADLEISDFGWNFLGPDSNPHQQTWAFVAVHNKSGRVWHGVAVQLRLMDRQGSTFAHTAISVGTLAPGQTRKSQTPVNDPRVSYSGITGITAL